MTCLRFTTYLTVFTIAAAVFILGSAAQGQSPLEAMFDRFDANADGLITTEEVSQWRTQVFDRVDADANDYVTGEELEALRAEMDAARQAQDGDQDRPRFGRRAAMMGGGDPLARLDADGDGQLSRTEYVDAPFRALDRFDANEDGALSRDELPTGRGMRRRG